MSTLEKLFVQIFDRKNWIIDQLQQQRDLYDQYLASKLLINGIRPPSWLWNTGLETGSAELKELKKEELISGLLFPPLRPNIPSTVGYNTLYNRSDVTANNGQSQEVSFTETCASNKYFNVGDRSTLVPKCHLNEPDLGCTLIGVPELDQTIISPREDTDAKMADTSYEPDLSLARIQRSKSRQKALELRNSAEVKSKKRPRKESCTGGAFASRTTRSRTSNHPNQVALSRSATHSVEKLQSLDFVDQDDGPNTVPDTQVIIQSSRTGQKDVKLCNVVETNTEKHPSNGDITDECNKSAQLEKSDNSSIPSGIVTRSRSASINKSSQLEKPLNLVQGHDFLKALDAPLPTVLCNDVGDLVHQERCIAGVGEIEFVSNVDVEARTIHSGSNMLGAHPGEGMEFLVLKPSSDNSTFVEPKHLVFDDIEDCILNETIIPDLEDEKRDGAPEMQTVSLGPAESSRNVTISDDEKDDSFIDEKLMENDHNIESVHRKDKRRAFAEDHEEERPDSIRTEKSEPDFNSTSTAKTSNFSSLLSRTRLSDVNEDEATETFSESNKTRLSDVNEDEATETFSESNKILKQVFIESSREVTISNAQNEKCGLSTDEQLVEKDLTVEVADGEEELKAFSGAHGEEKVEFFSTDRSECGLYPTSSATKSPNLSPLSSRKGQHDAYDDLVAGAYAENEPTEALKNVTISNDTHEEAALYVEFPGPDNTMEVVNREEDGGAYSKTLEGERFKSIEKEKSDFSFHPALSSGKISNASLLSSEKGKSLVYEDVEADLSPESNQISKKATSSSDHLNILRVGRKSSLVSQLQEVHISLPDVGMDQQKDSFDENCTRNLNMVPHKELPEDYKLNMNPCGDPDFNNVTGFSLVKKPEVSSSLGAQVTKSSYVVASDAAKRSVLRQAVTPNTTQVHSVRGEAPYFLRNYTNPDKDAGCSKSNESCFENRSIQLEKAFNTGWEKSWPQYKRRKTEIRSSNALTISPRLMTVEQLQRSHEDNTCRCLKSAEDGMGAVLESQHFPITCDLEIDCSNVIESPGVEKCRSEKCHETKRFGSSSKLQTKDSEIDMEERDQEPDIPLGFRKTQLVNFLNSSTKEVASGNSHGCFKDERGMEDTTSIILDTKGQFPSEDDDENLMSLESVRNMGNVEQIISNEGTTHKRNSNVEEQLFSYCSVGSPHYEDHGLIGADQTMLEFEGFSFGVPTENLLPSISGDIISFGKSDLPMNTTDRISVLEQLCRSTSLLTPLPRLSKYKLHTTPNIYQSLPNGLSEGMDLRNTFLFNDDDVEQLEAKYNFLDVEVDHNFLERSCSSFIPSSSCNVGNPPYTPPVGKLCQRITSKSAGLSSQDQTSVNPGRTCFRIDEDISTCEENGNLSEAVVPLEEGISPSEMDRSTNREPLIDVTNINPFAAVCATEKLHERGSLDSVNMELNFHETQTIAQQKLGNSFGNELRYKGKNKENPSSSIGGNGVGKTSESLHNRVRRSKLSGRASEKKESQSFLDKGLLRTNIVSNISSFIPLVQPKRQPSAVLTGKRDVKVKALEAAEAAKRIEEKKENDRKMKKEATKMERARLEQEKIKQLELQRKKKEEERRKKEADVAARKRQREEDERKGKEKKRKCIEEAQRQQKEQEEKLRAKKEKDLRCRTVDEREGQRKELHAEEGKHRRTEKGREKADYRKMTEIDTRIAMDSAVDSRKASNACEDFETFKESRDIEKVVSNFGKGNQDGSSVTQESREQSYEISPFQGSDDEDENEDNIPKKKSISSWAREKRLSSILPSLQQIDPYEIFPPGSFCSRDEVILPRKNPK